MAELVRVARDQSAVIVESDGWYSIVKADNTLGESSDRLAPLLASGSWRKAIESDTSKYATALTVLASKNTANRQVRLPKSLSTVLGKDTMSLAEVAQLRSEQEKIQQTFSEFGGPQGLEWANNILGTTETLVAAGAFEPSEELTYLATSNQPDTTQIDSLFAVTPDNLLMRWTGKRFDPLPIPPEDLDEPTIIEVDSETAQAIADWVEDGELDGYIDIAELDAEEAALFSLALPELDLELLGNIEGIIAAAFYDNAKREQHAERQERDPEGKFNGPQHEPGKKRYFARARVPDYYEQVSSPADRITQYVNKVKGTPVLLAAGPMNIPEEAQEPAPAPEEAPAEAPEQQPTNETEPLYMAIVDDVDHTAVLNLVAIIKDDTGTETSWVRQNGLWVADPKYLEQLRSDTPPTVVELTDQETIKDVLRQIDSSDLEEEEPPTEEAPVAASALADGTFAIEHPEDIKQAISTYYTSAPEERPSIRNYVTTRAHELGLTEMVPEHWMSEFRDFSPDRRKALAKKGHALPDGSYPIVTEEDLKNAIHAYGRSKPGDRAKVRRHIMKRARALGNVDLIPEDWKSASVDSETLSLDEFREFSPDRRKKLAQQGFALPDGSYPIVTEEDLKNAIQAYGRATPDDKDAVRRHIRKRARALGRADLLPENWKTTAVIDMMSYYEEMHRLYDDFGRPVLAAGVPGVADAPEDWAAVRRLKNYWKYGKGGLKIRWGTPGDLTRCHRHLNKYMPGRAWGYCNTLHKELFGIWNPESGRKKS